MTQYGEYDRHLRNRRVKYIVMSPQSAQGISGLLKSALAPYVGVGADSSLVQKQPMPGWRAIYIDPSVPSRFVIYEDAHDRPSRS